MYFSEIRLINFGQYNGEHVLDLCPRQSDVELTQRPIVLIGGHNGAGKTTLLEAVKLCLYGAASLGPGTRASVYETYLLSHIHRQLGAPLQNDFAGVVVTFSHTITGASHVFQVRRFWKRKGRSANETLTVLRDGVPLGQEEYAWWYQFLHDLLPPGLADLFFFDGEKIQALAEDMDYTELGNSIRALLGLDLLDRLRADLAIYIAREKRGGEASLEEELRAVQDERARVEEAFNKEFDELNELNARLSLKRGKIEHEERLLDSEGGRLATQREALKQRAEHVRADIRRFEHAIAEQANELLPFAVIPDLCAELQNRLMAEEQRKHATAVQNLSNSFVERLFGRLIHDDSWLALDVAGPQERSRIIGRVVSLVEQVRFETGIVDGVDDQGQMLHDVSNRDRQELFGWINQAITGLPEKIQVVGAELETATHELAEIEAHLVRMPSDEVLQPIFQRLTMLNQEVARLEVERDAQAMVVDRLRLKRTEVERAEQDLYARMMRGDDPAYRMQLAGRAQLAIARYEEVMRQNKLRDLEKRIVECFGRLNRKGNYVKRVTIDPKTFATTLFNQRNEPLPKEQLSAGEKQIYAVAVLWALRLVSGRSVPIIVDTPLGRLDSEHRHRLVHRYFPHASHQVIVLSTDTEISDELYHDLQPAIAREYHLNYQPTEATTEIRDGYFWTMEDTMVTEELVV